MKIFFGTAAALAIVGYLCLSSVPQPSDINLFATNNSEIQSEIEQAFISYIAKYGRSYASKAEIPARFAKFSENYMMIKAHNNRPDATFKMQIN